MHGESRDSVRYARLLPCWHRWMRYDHQRHQKQSHVHSSRKPWELLRATHHGRATTAFRKDRLVRKKKDTSTTLARTWKPVRMRRRSAPSSRPSSPVPCSSTSFDMQHGSEAYSLRPCTTRRPLGEIEIEADTGERSRSEKSRRSLCSAVMIRSRFISMKTSVGAGSSRCSFMKSSVHGPSGSARWKSVPGRGKPASTGPEAGDLMVISTTSDAEVEKSINAMDVYEPVRSGPIARTRTR